MQLPIDVKAVLDEATNIDEAARTPVSVSLYVDGTCPSDALRAVQGAFEAQAPHARVAYCMLDDALSVPFPGDDAAVIVAGLDERVGEAAASLRAVGVPTMVVTTLPSLGDEIAKTAGHPIPQGDVIAPGGAPVPARKRLLDGLRGKLIAGDVTFTGEGEPGALDDAARDQLRERMGACRNAYAHALCHAHICGAGRSRAIVDGLHLQGRREQGIR